MMVEIFVKRRELASKIGRGSKSYVSASGPKYPTLDDAKLKIRTGTIHSELGRARKVQEALRSNRRTSYENTSLTTSWKQDTG